MNHLSEEQLILHYYGEEGDTLAAEQHLDECEECRGFYASLQRVLNIVDSFPVPPRGSDYGAAVWQRIEEQIPARRRLWLFPTPWRWAGAAAALAALLMVAFMAGRFYPKAGKQTMVATAPNRQAGERVLLVAVGDYLERSQAVLIELTNATPGQPLDISAEKERATDLVSENRLYRQTAAHTDNAAVTSVLDELERVLVDIAHEPSQISAQELERLHGRLESQGILFKVQVLGSNVKHEKDAPGKLGQSPAGQKL
jgi:hypothetical protein